VYFITHKKAFVLHSIVLGVDIGGSHITTALFDSTARNLLTQTHYRKEVDADGTADGIINNWCSAIRKSWQLGGISGSPIGIAMPGPFNYEQGICLIQQQKKYRSLYGMNIREILSKKLEVNPTTIQFINDACAFLQGEVVAGSVRRLHDVLGITLGTGLGSALYTNGSVIDADLWKMPYRSGIAEDYLSTGWFIKEYKLRSGEDITGVKELLALKPFDGETVKAIFSEFAKNLASFIDLACRIHKTKAVVIGGNIANAHPEFLGTINELLSKRCPGVETYITALGEQAVIAGAAAIFDSSGLSIKKLPDEENRLFL
jgi:glucokinase